ncbi:hypothetical protein [Marinomonas shanghaiensis]|uniref:hypothetical protein n=1 Tax=Marinomonas shanghaiensis TaxID=2202418 RepID=UPI0013001FD5|nr:hypothetical protein [Marinomonas shanghaiensis]
MYSNADQFDCNHCTWGRHCDKNNPAPIKQWVIDDVIESDTCLKPMITHQSNELISLYSHFQKNRFPLSGGLLDQPESFIRAMNIIEKAEQKNE